MPKTKDAITIQRILRSIADNEIDAKKAALLICAANCLEDLGRPDLDEADINDCLLGCVDDALDYVGLPSVDGEYHDD